MARLCFIFGLLIANPASASGFPGGHEALVSVTTTWIATDQAINRDSIKVTPPDRRIPVVDCQTDLSIRFPFTNNQRTIEVTCDNPSWKRYLRVKIDDQQSAWVFSQYLMKGTQVRREHITYGSTIGSFNSNPLGLDEIIGRVILKDVSEGDVATADLLSKEITVYIPRRSYEAGEVISLGKLSTKKLLEDTSGKLVTVWPEQTVVSKTQLKPGEPIQAQDIEIAERVLIAKTTIVNGQVITENLVESKLEATTSYGPQALTRVEEIIGLEATRTIRAGQRLNASDFVAADLVRKNETVRLVIKRGALEITVETIAMENGKIGEQVLLKNPDSGKEIRGIVIGRHEARGL
jgi:flagella basal body P-ring formation protein FlgA